MITSNQIVPGMTLSLNGELYRVESCVKVTVTKGHPFMKTRLRALRDEKVIEKNFKLTQQVEDVALQEKQLEFLYLEGKQYLFLDVGNLDRILVSAEVVGDRVQFLKEGVEMTATCYGETIFAMELPPFLEIMVAKTDAATDEKAKVHGSKRAVLETGAVLEVPRFIEVGDIIKVDTKSKEYIQRV